MASVFRVKDREGKYLDAWRFKFKDSAGKWCYGIGWPDKRKTKLHALAVEAEHRAVNKGEKAAPPSWLKERNKPIADVITEYLAWGRAQGGRYGRAWDDQNAELKERSLNWWVNELNLNVLSDIKLGPVEKRIQKMLSDGYAPKSAALQVEALRCLCLWSIKRGYAAENPLAGMAKLDTRPKNPHRPLNDDEFAKLLSIAPPHRKIWYETALGTGFRLNELRSLRVKDFDVFGPSLLLAADFSKDRKEHRQLIERELADVLRDLAAGRDAEEPLLGIPKGPDPAAYIGADFDKAGIKRETAEGKATWHSLRKTYVNALVRSGQDLKTIMTLARHSSAQLSMEVYASADPKRLRKAADAAAQHVKAAVLKAKCCTGVARKVVGAEDIDVNASAESALRVLKGMGDTGLEPVTLSLSS